MSSEHLEYNCDTNPYPSFGKKYNGEKAVISLTSWKARINIVSKTLFSLVKNCPGFHIVLVLSEEEFPRKEDELPKDLRLLIDNKSIEILWVYKNYKSFKKVLFTMDKYRSVPVISADDDCIYTCDYAEKLYESWYKDQKCINTINLYNEFNVNFSHGPATIFPNDCFKKHGIAYLENNILKTNHDDVYYGCLAKKYNIEIKNIDNNIPYLVHNDYLALSSSNKISVKKAYDIINSIILKLAMAKDHCHSQCLF